LADASVGARPPHSKATIEEVAREAGVSVATVSRALRGLPHVAEPTKARVREAAAKLRYVADPNAAGLASGRSRIAGFVAPLFGTWYASEVASGVEQELALANYDLLIAAVSLPIEAEEVVQRLRSLASRLDGVILVDFFPAVDEVLSLPPTLAAISLGDSGVPVPTVCIDDRAAARTAAAHLLGLGHRRVAVVGDQSVQGYKSPVPANRRRGFEDAHRNAGVAVDPSLVRRGNFTIAGGHAATAELLALPDPPTAIFFESDEMAFGGLHAARERGVRVPDDLSIVGFDDHDASAPFELTTIRQPVADLGRTAAKLLLETLDGRGAAEQPVRVELPTELVVRATTAPPAGP
jgi:DNA-binding LacI/PurR family transcriptional regulator